MKTQSIYKMRLLVCKKQKIHFQTCLRKQRLLDENPLNAFYNKCQTKLTHLKLQNKQTVVEEIVSSDPQTTHQASPNVQIFRMVNNTVSLRTTYAK